jgi:two-component system, chemotaxis family, protein-glutamate methylesterase/glutaminase
MPGLDGLQTVRHIMAEYPRPVIIVSSLTLKDVETTFSALAAGAFDYVPKELSSTSLDIYHLKNNLIARIKAAAESRHPDESLIIPRKPSQAATPKRAGSVSPIAIVATGISTGGPKALQDILPALPTDIPVPILVVQHMPLGFTAPFVKRLNNLCAISVREAANGENLMRHLWTS